MLEVEYGIPTSIINVHLNKSILVFGSKKILLGKAEGLRNQILPRYAHWDADAFFLHIGKYFL